MRRAPWSLLLLAAVVRAWVCVRTELPGRDGVSYLWMAERAAAGDWHGPFATVFHPLYPLLVAPLLWAFPGLAPETAGQLTAAGLAAAALLPLWAVARALAGDAAARWTAFAYAIAAWFARHPAECMSEGPFYLAVASWAWALARARSLPAVAGIAAGAAYLLRPEGAALSLVAAAWLAHRRAWRALAQFLAVAAPLSALLPLGFAVLGDGLTLTPKAAFNYEVGVGGMEHPLAHYALQAAALPLAAWEELGWLLLPLAVAGAIRHRPIAALDRAADARVLLLVPLLLQCLVVPMLHSHWRFLSGFGLLLLPFAGMSLADLAPRLAHRGRWAVPALVGLLLAAEVQLVERRNDGRAIERELGVALRPRLGSGEVVVSDMPRLCWYAGQKPPPPRPFSAAGILAAARQPDCRFVALAEDRTELTDAQLAEVGLERTELPGLLSALPGRRVRLFERSRPR